ncbi:MAG TPA: S8 family peptidase [Rubrobacter sp.]|nr:S8 family peptidase [Rubrobacter sp.]
MRRYIGFLIVASVVLMAGFVAPQERAPSEPAKARVPSQVRPELGPKPDLRNASFEPGQILVETEAGVPADAIKSVNRRNDASVEESIPHSRISLVDLPQGLSVAEAIQQYRAAPEVKYAEPNYQVVSSALAPTPNDPSFPKMWDAENRGQYGGTFDADIDAPEAWAAETGSADTVVAVIDTGMDIGHKDLRDNIWTNPDEVPGNGTDDDGNGYIDDVHGWDFYHDDKSVFDSASQDTHATHVAGTIAAEGNNTVGVTGINWHVKIMPLKFIGPDNQSNLDDAIEAINYSVAEGAKISNNSWGYEFPQGNPSKILQDAINDADQAGQLFVVAAMNGGDDFIGDDIDQNPVYPASYTNSNIISVAATNDTDSLTSFSNYGSTSVDLAAPGKDILSTLPGNSYGYGYGTSMATPHVTGVAALIKSQNPQLTDEGIKTRILDSVDKKASLEGKMVSGGRLNAAKALGANTAPVIIGQKPRVRAGRAGFSATVRDDETDLTKDQIYLYLDGNRKFSFSYDQATNKLTYSTSKLASRRHSIKIVAKDAQALQESRAWGFRV